MTTADRNSVPLLAGRPPTGPEDPARDIVAHAWTHSSFYRSHWADHLDPDGATPPLASLPFVAKTDIIAAQASAPPFGGLLTVDPTELVRTTYSPGPEYLAWTRGDWDAMVRRIAGGLEGLAGVRSTDVVDVTLSYHWVPAGTLFQDIFARVGCNIIPGGPGMSQTHIEVLAATEVSVLFGFTPFIEHLGQEWAASGREPADAPVRLLVVGGEMRDAEATTRLSKMWGGADVVEYYGVAEAGVIAMECLESSGMHLLDDVLLEIVDPDSGVPVAAGASGELVVTDLARRGMPVVRYRSGDIVEGVHLDPCACGRRSPRLGRVIGRSGSVHRVRGLFVNPVQVADVIATFPSVTGHRIVIDRVEAIDSLTIEVECVDGATPDLETELQEHLQQRIRLRPQVRVVSSLEPGNETVVDRRRF